MKSATVQQLPLDVPQPLQAAPALSPSSHAPQLIQEDDGLPPPTKAQVFYWAQLCGELTLRGVAGIADADGWSADLAPSASTLRALQERRLVARRDRAWKLRRRWYERLTALKARAVDTPSLAPTERPRPDLPTYAELEAWEAVCRWLDAQPGRRARLPFVGLTPLLHLRGEPHPAVEMPVGPFVAVQLVFATVAQVEREHEEAEASAGEHAALLKAMRRYRLVRHMEGCAWALSPRWREKLRDLYVGIDRALREYAPPPPASVAARSLCAGLDTWALNWLVEEGTLPARLRIQLDDYQELARAHEGEVDTAWVYDSAPLRIYQAGVRAKGADGKRGKAKGVSWSYILVNPSLRLLIRRTPLGGIVANARLGSECLWRRTPRAALDELDALVRQLWGKERGHWQVSYVHLAHDVANAPLERGQLDCYVSRSRRQAVYDAAKMEMERLLREARPRDAVGADLEHGLDYLGWDGLPPEDALYDWEAEYSEDEDLLLADAFAEEGYEWDRTPEVVKQARADLDGDAAQRSVMSYIWGKRLSGVAFSPGGAVSFVMYRKDWEGRLKNKRHMEPLWKAAGWDGKEPVTRHEARLLREPLRELRVVGSDRAILDDPWTFLDHLSQLWARMVGQADTCPEMVDVAWLRRVVPRAGESNRSRWDTDPVWRVVQQATFTPASLAIRRLVRRIQHEHEVRRLDKGILGYVAKREALLHPDPAGRDISLALRDLVEPLDRELYGKGEHFDQAVRRKRQEAGLPVRLATKVLPLRPRQERSTLAADRQSITDLEQQLAALSMDTQVSLPRGADADIADGSAAMSTRPSHWRTWAELRAHSAEVRMRQAYAALESAELVDEAPKELDRLGQVFMRATAAYDAALFLSQRLSMSQGGDGTGGATELTRWIPRLAATNVLMRFDAVVT